MTIYGDDPDPPPSTHLLRNTIRKIRRLYKGGSPRQQIVILLGWLLLLYAAFRVHQYLAAKPSTPVLVCETPTHEQSQHILLPKAPDKVSLSRTWKTLQAIYDAHPPQPLNLTLKTFKSVSEFPALEDIKNHTRISTGDAQASRKSHVEVTKKLLPYPDQLFSGQGIVVLAGGRYTGFATTGLGMLREVGSKLPIEVWVKNQEEENEEWCKELANEGIACRRLSDYMDTELLEHGYQLKISSILFSSFEQILFLDADNVPVRSPDVIFKSKSFTNTGVVMWPDYWKHTGAPLLPYIVGLSERASEMLREDQTVESGQLMWDKKRHWKALCLAAYYNYYGPQHYYTMISQGWAGWGDKDTFLLALRSLRQDFYIVPHKLMTLFVNGTSHGIGMLQADPTKSAAYEPMFLHSNIIKWSIRGFFCSGCTNDEDDPVELSAWEDPESSINPHLKEHRRIFPLHDMKSMNIDPEPLIWKSFEHVACRSVWQSPDLCNRTREHMEQTFGYEFKRSGKSPILGGGDQISLVFKALPGHGDYFVMPKQGFGGKETLLGSMNLVHEQTVNYLALEGHGSSLDVQREQRITYSLHTHQCKFGNKHHYRQHSLVRRNPLLRLPDPKVEIVSKGHSEALGKSIFCQTHGSHYVRL
ncbi:MAG: hypothetical protein Q9166_000850 [cf. Caloplaca sp. 2 TL-2023]